MSIRVARELINKLYFYLFQAERSIDKVLGNDWHDLLAYYHPEQRNAIQVVIDDLESLLRDGGQPPRFDRAEIMRRYPSVGLFRYLFGKLMARRKRLWSFPGRELAFMAWSLEAVLRLLHRSIKPDPQELVALRMDLCSCRSIIEIRCYGLPILDHGLRFEHLYQSSWISPVTLAEVLTGNADPVRPARRSA